MKFYLIILLLLVSVVCHSQTVNDLRPTVTMKEYVDMQAELNRKLAEVQFQNVLDNVNKANITMDKRLDGMNEFRETLKDSNSTYVTWQALIGLIIGVSGFLFGYSRYVKDKKDAEGKNIMSGDKVEVKK